jgi:hypothetical protein
MDGFKNRRLEKKSFCKSGKRRDHSASAPLPASVPALARYDTPTIYSAMELSRRNPPDTRQNRWFVSSPICRR